MLGFGLPAQAYLVCATNILYCSVLEYRYIYELAKAEILRSDCRIEFFISKVIMRNTSKSGCEGPKVIFNYFLNPFTLVALWSTDVFLMLVSQEQSICAITGGESQKHCTTIAGI